VVSPLDIGHERGRDLGQAWRYPCGYVAIVDLDITTERGALPLKPRGRIVGSGLIAIMAIGLAGAPCGCGGSAGTSSQDGVEKVPESVEQMKNIMKERAAALKGRKGGVPGKR
jgi:hypothetical protein